MGTSGACSEDFPACLSTSFFTMTAGQRATAVDGTAPSDSNKSRHRVPSSDPARIAVRRFSLVRRIGIVFHPSLGFNI
jgi:hypothetical protein